MRMKAYRATIKGRVTGVGFRYSAIREARRYPSVTGWVRNADDRVVEAFVQGDDDEVEEMLAWLRHGPECAHVEEFDVLEAFPDASLTTFGVDF